MNALLYAAAALLVLIGVAHSVLGERYILIRLFRRELPPLFGSDWFTRRTLRFAWHATTVAWWGIAAVLVLMAGEADPRRGVLYAVATTFFISFAVALMGSRGRHLSWVVFLAVALLTYLAAGAP